MAVTRASGSIDSSLPTPPSESEQRKLAVALGLFGGLLMSVFPFVVSNTVYNPPLCLSGAVCPWVLPASLQGTLFFLRFVAVIIGVGVITASLMVRLGRVHQPRRYGWTLIILALIHVSVLALSTALAWQYNQFLAGIILYVPGPLMVMGSGWLLLTEKQKG